MIQGYQRPFITGSAHAEAPLTRIACGRSDLSPQAGREVSPLKNLCENF